MRSSWDGLVSAAGWRATFYVCGAIGFVWLAAWLIWFRQPEQAIWLGDDERQMILRERPTATMAVRGTPTMGVLCNCCARPRCAA